jgi:hypothetical protein
MLDYRNEKFPENDFEKIKFANSLRIRLDESCDRNEDFKIYALKLMQFLIDFNKYISQRVDELAPWKSRMKLL